MKPKPCQHFWIAILCFLALTFLIVHQTPAQPVHHGNGKIAFTSDRDGNPEIYVMNADGSDQVRITTNALDDDHPEWSPDGRRVAFACGHPPTAAVCVTDADGKNKSEITTTTHPAWITSISWSPDGSQIAYAESRTDLQQSDIYVVDVDGANKRLLVAAADGPSWSPDGLHLVFGLARLPIGTGSSLYTIRADGTDINPLPGSFSSPSSNDFAPQWSPVAGKIVFLFDFFDVNQDVYIANLDGTDRMLLDGCTAVDINACIGTERDAPHFSPDGTKVIFNKWDPWPGVCDIFSRNIDGSDPVQLTHGPGRNFHPSWQPLASDLTVGGRVRTVSGTGIRNAVVYLEDAEGNRRSTLTSSFGYYSFDNVGAGGRYTISVSSRRYRFDPLVLQINDNQTTADLIGVE